MKKPYNRPAGVGNAFPLWWLAPPPFPRKRGHYKAPLCCELLMKGLLFRALFCPLHRGKSGTLGPKGRQTYEPSGPKDRSILRTLPHNADFISIARKGDTTTLSAAGAVAP